MKAFEPSLTQLRQSLVSKDYGQVFCQFNPEQQALWTRLYQPDRIPCINHALLEQLHAHHTDISRSAGYVQLNHEAVPIHYSVFASATPGYFNMGGDLQKMADAIRRADRSALEAYAKLSIEVVAQRTFRFNLDHVTKISLLQGETLGAGIEAALTSDVLIAERQTVFCFPEMFFNMIPGMGAYSLIARKAGMTVADKMIMGCERYTAEECQALGIIDIVVEEGEGEAAVAEYIHKNSKRAEGLLAAHRAKFHVSPLRYDELASIVAIWVDNALHLTPRDLKVMDRFYRAQAKLFATSTAPQMSSIELHADSAAAMKPQVVNQ